MFSVASSESRAWVREGAELLAKYLDVDEEGSFLSQLKLLSLILVEDPDGEDEDGDEAPEVGVDASGHPLLPEISNLPHQTRQDVVREIFRLAYREFDLILTPMVQTLFLVRLTKKPKIPVPWLLLAKSAKDYVDMDCLPEGFVIADPSKFTKKVLDKLWAHWASRRSQDEPILQFTRARDDDLPFGLPRVERLQVRKKRCYVEIGSSDDEQEFVAGKGKAADASMSSEAGPSSAGRPLSKRAHLSGQPEVPEDESPAANQHDRFSFLEGLSRDPDYQGLVRILSSLPVFVGLSLSCFIGQGDMTAYCRILPVLIARLQRQACRFGPLGVGLRNISPLNFTLLVMNFGWPLGGFAMPDSRIAIVVLLSSWDWVCCFVSAGGQSRWNLTPRYLISYVTPDLVLRGLGRWCWA